MQDNELRRQLNAVNQAVQAVANSDPERTEGTDAFVEKRDPDYAAVHHTQFEL